MKIWQKLVDRWRGPDEYPLPSPAEIAQITSPNAMNDAVLLFNHSANVQLAIVKREKLPFTALHTCTFVHALNFGTPILEWTDDAHLRITASCDHTAYSGPGKLTRLGENTFELSLTDHKSEI